MKKWQIQEAKAKLNGVIQNIVNNSTQLITIRGKDTTIVLSFKEYQQFITPKKSFIKFLQNSPLHGIDIDLSRDKSLCRHLI